MNKFIKRLKLRPIYLIVSVVIAVIIFTVPAIIIGTEILKSDSKSSNSASAGEEANDTKNDTPDKNIGEVVNDNPSCSLPVIEYTKSAFSFGVPKGWMYDVQNGTISISQDDTSTTSVYIYTAKLEEDIGAQEFLERFAQIFEQTFTDLNGSFSMNDPQTNGASSEATTAGNIGKDKVQGIMKAQVNKGFVLLTAYWAPSAEFEDQKTTFEQIVGCFGRTRIITDALLSAKDGGSLKDETVSKFKTYQGKYFKLSKPDNFKVTGETDSGIDLTRSDGNAGYSYAYATGVAGTYNPKSWAEKALPQFAGIKNLRLGTGRNITSPIKGQTIQEFDFSGILNGSINVQGKTTVGIYLTPYTGIGTQYSSAFWGIQIATPSAWPSAKGTLQQIQDSLVITDIGNTRKNTILPPNRPIESVSASSVTRKSSYSSSLEKSSSDKWADAMRGYETVESPSTGERYDVPQNSWSSYGPEGPGYYKLTVDNSLEKLQQTN